MANENEKKPVEEKETLTPPAEEKSGVDTFLEAAKKVKEGSVSKEEFEKLQADNKKLMDFILEGKELPSDDKSEPIPTIAELQKIRRNPNSTNLEYVKASLGIRKHIIEEKGFDPFASKEGEEESARRVADALQKMVDEAGDDPKKFNFLLESRVAEDDPALAAALRKRK